MCGDIDNAIVHLNLLAKDASQILGETNDLILGCQHYLAQLTASDHRCALQYNSSWKRLVQW